MNARAPASIAPAAAEHIVLRMPNNSPDRRDGAYLHDLIARCPPLDLNSRYAYLLVCEHHADTCVVAEFNGELVGAITAYIPPSQPDTLFIWQVAVAPTMQGQRLGSRMLDSLTERCAHTHAYTHIETTISPSNSGSQKLFASYARRHHVEIKGRPYFATADFGDGRHEEEWLYQIGPRLHVI